MKKLWLLALLCVMTGCALFTVDKDFPVQQIAPDPELVKGCRLVGTFPGPSGYRFMAAPTPLADFKRQTAEKAKQMGATHIYWWEGGGKVYGEVTGFAFDCTGVDMKKYDEEDDEY